MTNDLNVRGKERRGRCGIAHMASSLTLCAAASALAMPAAAFAGDPAEWSIARIWNEQLLEAIRNDSARPPVHARNLYHVSAAMFDAWAVYDEHAIGVFSSEKQTAVDVQAAREEAISYAAYRVLENRFQHSPGTAITLQNIKDQMLDLGYDPDDWTMSGDSPRAVGNRCGTMIIAQGMFDGSNQGINYAYPPYAPMAGPLVMEEPGNPAGTAFPNNWQETWLNVQIGQTGEILSGNTVPFVGPHWGFVKPFALKEEHKTPDKPGVYLDPGPPPKLGESPQDTEAWIETFSYVAWLNQTLTPEYDGSATPFPSTGETLPEWLNLSPKAWGNNPLGENTNPGHGNINPVTGEPYEDNWVRHGDYARIIAEFWADGPKSSTPPGHWNEIANEYIADNPNFEKRIGGTGPIVDDLEWDVKMFLAVNGAAHDSAVACWGVKGYYDWTRPNMAIRHMADNGQSSDPGLPNYHPHGLPLIPGVIEQITAEEVEPGGKFAHLAEMVIDENGFPVIDPKTFEVLYDATQFIGEIAIKNWPGPASVLPDNPNVPHPFSPAPFGLPNIWIHPDHWVMPGSYSGTRWTRAKRWTTYQSTTFITPPFAGYTSGHTTFSRSIAEVLTELTGSPYFPDGFAVYPIKEGWLEFEYGPGEDVELQWATYFDCSDQSARSRIYGSIHPPADDIPARFHGAQIGPIVAAQAFYHFGDSEQPLPCAADLSGDGSVGIPDLLQLLAAWGPCPESCPADLTDDDSVGIPDLLQLLAAWGECP